MNPLLTDWPCLGRLIGLCWLAPLVGCADGLGLVPVQGTVTLDNKPVSEAGVLFTPAGQGMLASGETDENGRFVLRTADQDGAAVGEYSVTLNKSTTLVTQVPNSPAPKHVRVYEIPQKYFRPETSGLKATVSSDESANDFTYALKSK